MTQSDPLFLVYSIASCVPTNVPPSQEGGGGTTCQCPLYLSEEQILVSEVYYLFKKLLLSMAIVTSVQP